MKRDFAGVSSLLNDRLKFLFPLQLTDFNDV